MLDAISMLIIQWAIVFAVNVVPAFAPPTWMVLSFLYIAYPQNIFVLILVGATASTCGRIVLAKLSEKTVDKLAKREKKKQLEMLKERLDGKPLYKFLFSFVFSLGPLPSNMLFIVAGATKVRLREIIAGFFLGRLISYLFLTFTTEKVFSSLAATAEGTAGMWTIMVEIIGAASIIFFFKFDWEKYVWGMKKDTPVRWRKRKK